MKSDKNACGLWQRAARPTQDAFSVYLTITINSSCGNNKLKLARTNYFEREISSSKRGRAEREREGEKKT